MVNTKIFFAKEGTIKMDAAASISISNSTVLDTAFSGATTVTGQFKNLSISALPVGDVNKIDLIGTTSSFQNAELEETPAVMAEISANIVIPGDEVMESEIFGAGTAASGTHTTYEPGLATRTKIAILFNVDDGSDEINFAATNITINAGDLSMNADGHLEGNVTFKALPRDWFGPQFKD